MSPVTFPQLRGYFTHPSPATSELPRDTSGIAIILNPVSGTGPQERRRRQILRTARQLGWTGELMVTTPEFGADTLTKEALAQGCRRIVVCGGDGSVMEASNVLAGSDIPLGIIPSGTGNLLALNLGLPHNVASAMEAAFFGTPIKIDIGEANGTRFAVGAGIGWDAACARDARREYKRWIGLGAYLISALKNLRHPTGTYSVRLNGGQWRRYQAKGVLVANVGMVAKRLNVFPGARLDSGELCIAIVQTETLLCWLRLCLSILRGRTASDSRLVLLYGTTADIISRHGSQPIELDGNNFSPAWRLSTRIIPGGLTVMVPKG